MQCQGRTKLELASKHVLTIDDTAKIYSLFITYIYVPFTNLYRYFEVIIQLQVIRKYQSTIYFADVLQIGELWY